MRTSYIIYAVECILGSLCHFLCTTEPYVDCFMRSDGAECEARHDALVHLLTETLAAKYAEV